MNEITIIGQTQTMTSLQIAEITGMRHADVMRAIRNMEGAWVKLTERNFALSEYKDATGRKLPMFALTKTECLYVATKFNDEARARLVIRWEELERANAQSFQIPASFSEALMLAAKQAEQIEQQQKLLLAQGAQIAERDRAIAELHERTCYLDQILNSKTTVATTQIAQDYGMSAKKFNVELRNLKIQRKVGGQWILYAPYNTMGYVHSETFIPENSTTGRVVMTTKWTQKGRLFLYEKLKKNGILPVIER